MDWGAFIAENWPKIVAALVLLIGGGFVWKRVAHSGSSNYVDQRNVNTRGDVVGRDKIVSKDEAPRP